MMAEIEEARNAQARGEILRTLFEDYANEMTSVASLTRALDFMGQPLGAEDMNAHLEYLLHQDYVKLWRGRDMPQFRRDRRSDVAPDAKMFAKLSPKGLQLLKGKIPDDPMVAF